jgi:2-polyprenyl-3-methyl-5-hydroxy-6-metoxy-1,4-benzoquinol methylase
MPGDPEYYGHERRELLPFIPARAHDLLDIGCAGGGFGRVLRSVRSDVYLEGIELDPDAAAAARETYDVVTTGAFPDVVPKRQFDCITLNDVLEHIVDPWGALDATLPLLRPGGVVVACLPNVRNYQTIGNLLVRGRWDYADAGVMDRTHLRWFTRKTMVELFESRGFVVDDIVPINFDYRRPRTLRLAGLVLRTLVTELSAPQFILSAHAA